MYLQQLFHICKVHANRHCPDHPHGSLQRVSAKVAVEDLEKMRDAESNDDVRDWLDRYA
jgi:hypothetical protein